jgi:hypothetical protein
MSRPWWALAKRGRGPSDEQATARPPARKRLEGEGEDADADMAGATGAPAAAASSTTGPRHRQHGAAGPGPGAGPAAAAARNAQHAGPARSRSLSMRSHGWLRLWRYRHAVMSGSGRDYNAEAKGPTNNLTLILTLIVYTL